MGTIKKNVKEHRNSYSVQETRKVIGTASRDAIADLGFFKKALEALRSIASKKTHYQDLEQWNHDVYEFLHAMLHKHGFVSGDPEANALKPDAIFWWKIYSVVSNVIYSPHMVTEVAVHHSSAFDRNEALIKEVEDILR
jgi:hypothetical protein